MKLAHAQELLGQLATKPNRKVVDVEKGVSNLKCGFETFKDDMTVLETARSQVAMATAGLEPHDNEAASQLSDLLGAVENEKEKVLKEFVHPCVQGSWERVEYLNFRNAGTVCPNVFASGQYNERAYTCRLSNPQVTYACDKQTIKVNSREYTRVCGCARAYKFGHPNAFLGALTGLTTNEA